MTAIGHYSSVERQPVDREPSLERGWPRFNANPDTQVNARAPRPVSIPPLFRKPSMQRRMLSTGFLALVSFAAANDATASPELARSKNCMACHAVDQKLVGPSFKDVAVKYANDKDAETRLAKKIREGGSGVWGGVPMPANPQVSADEARALAKWVLSHK